MPTRVYKVNRIITTIAIQIATVYFFRVEVCRIIRRDKSSPLGRIVSRIEEIPTCFGVEVIASITEGVCIGYCGVRIVDNSTVSVCIISIFSNFIANSVINRNNVALEILLVVVRLRSCVAILELYANNSAFVVERSVYTPAE